MHPSLCDCGERHQPKMTGMCCLPLKSVLQADNLFLDKTLEVKDRSQAAGHNTSLTQDKDWPLVGHLKVRMEPYVAVWHNGYLNNICACCVFGVLGSNVKVRRSLGFINQLLQHLHTLHRPSGLYCILWSGHLGWNFHSPVTIFIYRNLAECVKHELNLC